jgi:hypothetical protein
MPVVARFSGWVDSRGAWLRALSRERRAALDAEWARWIRAGSQGDSAGQSEAEIELRKLVPSPPPVRAPGTVLSLLQRLHR